MFPDYYIIPKAYWDFNCFIHALEHFNDINRLSISFVETVIVQRCKRQTASLLRENYSNHASSSNPTDNFCIAGMWRNVKAIDDTSCLCKISYRQSSRHRETAEKKLEWYLYRDELKAMRFWNSNFQFNFYS